MVGLALATSLVVGLATAGCRPATVSVAFAPKVGDVYTYRYEIEATVTRTRVGQPAQVDHVHTVLVARQEVRARRKAGVRLHLVLTRDGGTPRTADVLVDRVGSLEGIQLVEDRDAAALGLTDDGSLGPSQLTEPPDRRLAPGERWTIRAGTRHGTGRLDRLGVVDDADVAVVVTRVTDDVDETGRSGTSETHLGGALRSTATTSYDLDGGAVRRSRSHATGQLDARVEPPRGSTAKAVRATIGYDIAVRVTRTD